MRVRSIAIVVALAMGACAPRAAVAAPNTAKRLRPKPKPKRPLTRTPYQAYVAFARMYAADPTAGTLAQNIPTADQIRISQLGPAIKGVTFYYADGGDYDDTPREVYASMLLADVDGRILEAFAPMKWAASNRWRAVACTEKYLPAQRALEKVGYTEQGLADLEAANCVDLTPRIAALFTADTTVADLDGLLGLLLMISDGPGLTVVHGANDLQGLPIEWVKPKPTLTAPTLTRDADGTIHATAFVATEHVLRLTLTVRGEVIELAREGVGSIHHTIP